jgi:hypothetical protein
VDGSCASEERPRTTLDVVNRCAVPVWVRYDDDPAAGPPDFDDRSATPIAVQASYRANVPDDDNDGVAVAVSAIETDVGTIIDVEPGRPEVALAGDRCPK